MLSKFVSYVGSSRAVGPLALAAAALGAAGALQYYDHYKLKTTRNKLYVALNEIDLINYNTQQGSEDLKKEKLVKALTYIREYMHQGSDAASGAESEDHNDRRNIVFDFGGMKKLVNILRDEELSKDSEVCVAALKALYNLIKAGPNERANIRTSFAGMGGIHLLLNMVFNETLSDEVREEAALVLRRGTYVDYYKKDFVEEVPRGSDGALALLADKASLQKIVDMLDKTYGKMKMGLVGTITHVSHLNDGAYVLSNMNVVDKLLKHIGDSKQELLVASIFCIATIAIANVQPDAPKLLEKPVLSQLFKQVVGRHGSKVMKRIGDILYALCYHLTYKGIYDQEFVKEKRRIITSLMAENINGSTVQLFTLISSANAEGKYRMAKVRHLVTQKSFSPEKHSELKKLAAEADALVQKEEAKKKKAMNPFGGGEMTPEMLQAMGLM